MSINTFTLFVWLLTVGLLSSCGSGNDSASPNDTPVTVVADSSLNNGTVTQDVNQNADEGSNETNIANPQNDDEDSQQEQANTDPQQQTEIEQPIEEPIAQSIADTRRASFGTAKLLVDLVPNGDSYPAKFHRIDDKLYFWTIDTDPRFANCSSHWGNISEDDKNIAFNLVATHPETGVVAMNKEIMTLGDFAVNPNDACAGYNGTVMQVYEQIWVTPQSATGQHQFALQFDRFNLGPDQLWLTDGSESNTRQQASGQAMEQSIFVGDKVFIVKLDGLSVSDTLSGDRRKLFETNNNYYPPDIRHLVKSAARQATFEITVGRNRTQIWTYDLDTDQWEKTFSIKPDISTYEHYETLLVDGETLLSRGYDTIEGRSALGFSSNYGDVTSFEILTDAAPAISNVDPLDTQYSPNADNRNNELFYTTTDYSIEPHFSTIWSYSEERVENVFSISEPGLEQIKVIPGHDGRFYVAGTRRLPSDPVFVERLELWSYDPQTGQLRKLSDADWYAVNSNNFSPNESYFFRYLNTPDGLIFVNLKDDSGRELWFTDGTSEGTQQLTDINPGTGNSDPQNFYYSGDAVYFSANDGVHGTEPWMIRISR